MRARPALVPIALVLAIGCQAGPEPFLVLSGPKDLIRVEVRDMRDETLWAIEAIEPATLSAIYWGEVPGGFTQSVPASGLAPRELADGEVLVVRLSTLRREFTHYGFARGAAGFQSNHGRMENRAAEVEPDPS